MPRSSKLRSQAKRTSFAARSSLPCCLCPSLTGPRATLAHPAFRWLGRTALLVIAMVLLVEALAMWIRKALAD